MAPPVTRRRLLQRGVFGTALLALGGGGVLAALPGRRPVLPKEGLLILSPRAYATLEAVAARLVPSDGRGVSVIEARTVFHLDRLLTQVELSARTELLQLFALLESALSGLLLGGGRARPFSRLSGPDQDAVLRAWESGRLTLQRSGFRALRALVFAAYYGSPVAWPGCGYPGPPEGFHVPDAPVWRGEGPRPVGNGSPAAAKRADDRAPEGGR